MIAHTESRPKQYVLTTILQRWRMWAYVWICVLLREYKSKGAKGISDVHETFQNQSLGSIVTVMMKQNMMASYLLISTNFISVKLCTNLKSTTELIWGWREDSTHKPRVGD